MNRVFAPSPLQGEGWGEGWVRAVALSIAAGTLALPAQAQRTPPPRAQLDCKPAQEDLVYDCTLRLSRRDGTPLPAGVRVSIGADMPSMPMAHNVRPVAAQPTAVQGEYRARLELEMHGEWAVKLRLSGAVNDLLLLHYEFDAERVKPIERRKPGGAG